MRVDLIQLCFLQLLAAYAVLAQISFNSDSHGEESFTHEGIGSEGSDYYYDDDPPFEQQQTLQAYAASDPVLYSSIDRARKGIIEFGTTDFREGTAIKPCVDPQGKSGICMPITSCQSLVNQLRNFNLITYIRIRQYECSRNFRSVNFCCSDHGGLDKPPFDEPPFGDPPISGPEECGVSTVNNIIGGIEIKKGEFPWISVIGRPSGKKFSVQCTATLISRNYILSAAHCFGGPTHVRLGEHNVQDSSDDGGMQEIRLGKVTIHSGYDSKRLKNDIAVVRLRNPATYNSFVRPACVPENKLARNLFTGESLTASGWGRTRPTPGSRTSPVPQKAQLPVFPISQCNRIYGTQHDNSITCAGTGQTSVCNGDSGGPFLYRDKSTSRYYVVGVTSFASAACNKGPSGFTRVGFFINWIKTNTDL